MYKKRKLEINPNKETRNELSSEIPVINKIVKRVISKDNVKHTYIKSDPSGKDFKDYMLSLRQITDLMCPKFSSTWRYYGLNFAGGHYGDSQYGTVQAQPGTTSSTATDVISCAIDDYISKPGGWCDTIAWEAGSQAWFESVFLPASWNTSTATLETKIHCQPSMSGIIDQSRNVFVPLAVSNSQSINVSTVSGSNTSFNSKRIDYPIHYNGGYQTHTFANNEEFKIHYECYEATPRDIMPWFYDSTRSGLNNRTYCRSVADLVASDYNTTRPPFTGNSAAAFTNGTYLVPGTLTGQIGSTAHANTNSTGQLISNKNDMGFKIKSHCSNTLKYFRISKPKYGSIEPGGKMVYTMKVKPFIMMDSMWRKLVKEQADDANHTGDDPYTNQYENHLVPRFSKILIVRFWSDIGNNEGSNAGFEVKDGEQNPHQYNLVSNLPGRLIHTVVEHHTARCVLPSFQKNINNKDFTKLLFDHNVTEQNQWVAINDETDDTTQMT